MELRNELDLADLQRDQEKEECPIWKITGCGVTFIGPKGPIMFGWVEEIIKRGGVPTLEVLHEYDSNR